MILPGVDSQSPVPSKNQKSDIEAKTDTYKPKTDRDIIDETGNAVSEAPASSSTPEKKPPKPIDKSKSSTPSIKDALNSLNKPKPQPPAEELSDGTETIGDQSSDTSESKIVSQEQLLSEWNTYINQLEQESPRMFLALQNQPPVLGENGTVIQKSFRNNALLDDFKQNYKIPLLAYLKDKLGNQELEIVEDVIEDDQGTQSKHYTDTDKLKHMIEKNPALQKLKKDFNLDFE